MRRILLACLLPSLIPAAVRAQDASPANPAEPDAAAAVDGGRAHDLEHVVVRGVQPGPKLWKVTKGDHVLWILGTLSPLPKDITWDSRRSAVLIAEAQEVVTTTEVRTTSHAGLFANLAALPLLIGLRNNPDGKPLSDVVPAELYQRWTPLKQKYIGSSRKVEGWRPLFAAIELYEAAIEHAGLSEKPVVQDAVEKIARHANVKVTTPMVDIAIDKPRAAVKEFKQAGIDDIDCFRRTLDRIDTDLGTMATRANAWASGDIDALRRLSYTDQMTACVAAVSRAQLEQMHGAADIDATARKAWLDAATGALERNQVSFAMLPIGRLVKPGAGYVARLRELGYTVEEPSGRTDDDAAKPAAAAAETAGHPQPSAN